ncbi:BZ3500_MvSof-1268-A1-R1_Chr1-3g02169 [Microbotryum saponariae]|uniref:BZ3500_MvSof-1268-A1-R1_Chr1-3g02169 protein n=1 Tax=Microbotryum saponariae TaxID=289078 RepID=A0A2X0KID9_9BASI|nr:BZ3500_MvSof-1268-A1-R1_Chr1-3g02169 [Microbotryum saponariae]SCZ95555.1 BZ3501_MvSof-1269-A2-R1_Chr1-3g01772 [Microbotryum saponariae]
MSALRMREARASRVAVAQLLLILCLPPQTAPGDPSRSTAFLSPTMLPRAARRATSSSTSSLVAASTHPTLPVSSFAASSPSGLRSSACPYRRTLRAAPSRPAFAPASARSFSGLSSRQSSTLSPSVLSASPTGSSSTRPATTGSSAANSSSSSSSSSSPSVSASSSSPSSPDRQSSAPQSQHQHDNASPSNPPPPKPPQDAPVGLEDFFGGMLGKRTKDAAAGGTAIPAAPKDPLKDFLSKVTPKTGGPGGNGNNNNKNNGDPTPPGNPSSTGILATTLAFYLIYRLTSSYDPASREITWQEFNSAFLSKGLVEKLTVINRAKLLLFDR